MKFAYLRVSTAKQNLQRQEYLAEDADRTFIDRLSGKDRERPELQKLIDQLRPGDEVLCHSIDRLARSARDALAIAEEIKDRGATLHLKKEGLKIAPQEQMSPTDSLMFSMFAAFAEFERSLMLERQSEAAAAAREAGRPIGRPSKLSDQQKVQVLKKHQQGVPIARLARDFCVSRSVIYRILRAEDV